LSLASPDTKNERNLQKDLKKKNEWSLDKSSSAIYYGENMFVVACLDVGQGHEVLGDVNN